MFKSLFLFLRTLFKGKSRKKEVAVVQEHKEHCDCEHCKVKAEPVGQTWVNDKPFTEEQPTAEEAPKTESSPEETK
jgi:hypothetical protein